MVRGRSVLDHLWTARRMGELLGAIEAAARQDWMILAWCRRVGLPHELVPPPRCQLSTMWRFSLHVLLDMSKFPWIFYMFALSGRQNRPISPS